MKADPELLKRLHFRQAVADDLPVLLRLLADDDLGKNREAIGSAEPIYQQAFDSINADKNQYLLVAELDNAVIAMLQLSFIPGLSRRGAWRALIEAVRVASHLRGRGIGRALMQQALQLAQARDCKLVQLTSDKQRAEAHRFYSELGFVDSHLGFKRSL